MLAVYQFPFRKSDGTRQLVISLDRTLTLIKKSHYSRVKNKNKFTTLVFTAFPYHIRQLTGGCF